ncbi:MAG: alpha/beta fold hydrolase [Acidobacteriota bacterium]
MLVHGWGGRGLQMGGFAEPLVEAGYRVLALDLPAHGESPGRSTSLPEAAAAVQAATRYAQEMTDREVKAVVAHSFGSVASAVAFSEEGPKPGKLVFVGASGNLNQMLDRYRDLTGLTGEVMDRLVKSLEKRFEFRWEELHPNRLGSRVDRELLVIHDTDDEETSWREASRLAASWPRASMMTTSGLGHFRILRDETVYSATVDFVAGRSMRLPP